jgi:hypothetical protein
MQTAFNPVALFTDKNGDALDGGSVYFGMPGTDPTVLANRIPVYWDAAGMVAAFQPLRTVAGYVANDGTPAQVFVNGDYSIIVLDKQGGQIIYEQNVIATVTAEITAAVAVEAAIRQAADDALGLRVTTVEGDVEDLQNIAASGGTLPYETWAAAVAAFSPYNAGTAYTKSQTMVDQGAAWVNILASTGVAPPTLPTTSNANWQIFRNPLVGQAIVIPITDAGTHTDPVVGGTVNNTGIFRWATGTSGTGFKYLFGTEAALAQPYVAAAAAQVVLATAQVALANTAAAAAQAAVASLVVGGGSIQFPRFGNLEDWPPPSNDASYTLPGSPTQAQIDAYNALIALPRAGYRGLAILPDTPRLGFNAQMRCFIPMEIPWEAMTNRNKSYRVMGHDFAGNYNWALKFFSPRHSVNGWRQNRRRFFLYMGFLGASRTCASQQIPETWSKVSVEPVRNAAGRIGLDIRNLETGAVLSGFGADPGGGYAVSTSDIRPAGAELSIDGTGLNLIGSGGTWTTFIAANTKMQFGGYFGADANENQWGISEALNGGYFPGSIGAIRYIEGSFDDPTTFAPIANGATAYSVAAAPANVKLDLTLTLDPSDAQATVGGVAQAGLVYTSGNVLPGSDLTPRSTTTYTKVITSRRGAYTFGIPTVRDSSGALWTIQRARRCTYNVEVHQPDDGTFNGGNFVECRVLSKDGAILVPIHEAAYFKFADSSLTPGVTVQIHPVIPLTKGGFILQTRVKGMTRWWNHTGDRVGAKLVILGQSQENNNTVAANERRLLRQSAADVFFCQNDTADANIQDIGLAVSAQTIRDYLANPAAVGLEFDKLRLAISDTQAAGTATNSSSRASLRRPTLYNLKDTKNLEHMQDYAEEILRHFDFDMEIGLQANTNQGAVSVIADWYLNDPLTGNFDVGPGQWEQTKALAAFMGPDITAVDLDWWTDQIGYEMRADTKFMDGLLFGRGQFVYRVNSVPAFIANDYFSPGYGPTGGSAWNNYWIPVLADPGYTPNQTYNNYWSATGEQRYFMQLFDPGTPVFIQPFTRHNVSGTWDTYDNGWRVGVTRDSVEAWRARWGFPRGPEPGDVKLLDQFHPEDDHEQLGRTKFARYRAHNFLWCANIIGHPPTFIRPDPASFVRVDPAGGTNYTCFEFDFDVPPGWVGCDGNDRDFTSVDGGGNPLSDITAAIQIASAPVTGANPNALYTRKGFTAFWVGPARVRVKLTTGAFSATAVAQVLPGGPMAWGMSTGSASALAQEARSAAMLQWPKFRWNGIRNNNGICANAAQTAYSIV